MGRVKKEEVVTKGKGKGKAPAKAKAKARDPEKKPSAKEMAACYVLEAIRDMLQFDEEELKEYAKSKHNVRLNKTEKFEAQLTARLDKFENQLVKYLEKRGLEV